MAEWMPDQLVGQFNLDGVDPRKARLRHSETISQTAFSTTGEIVYPDAAGKPTISRRVSCTALTDEEIAIVIEHTTALTPIEVRRSSEVNLALANDIFNGSARKIAGQGKEIVLAGAKNLGTVEAADEKANAPSMTLVTVRSPWLCVDDRLGIALLDGSKEFTINDCSGRNAPWGSLQYEVICADERGTRKLKAGELIIDSAFVLVAGDRKTTARIQRTGSWGSTAEQPAVRYVTVTAPSGKRYLIVANLDGTARMVRIPGYPGLRFEFDGFGTQVRELNPGRRARSVQMGDLP